ncbi:MAG: patatin family protein [Ruminococcaceae bacterium]|nr:patatin family protein [Oscillospiraceae bacterium]
MKTGLVMEGGAMRGMFTAGVIDVMMENGIILDGAIGVSAGAAFGCNYKSGQIGRVIRYNVRFAKDPRFCSVRSLIKTGNMFGADFCYREIPYELDLFDYKAYAESEMEFYVVCTDVETGEAVYKKCDILDGDQMEWLRASASLPLASKIVEIEGKGYLDGGISDSVPLKYFESIGYTKNVVILTQPDSYRKRKAKMLPIMRIAMRKYPEMVRAMATRHDMYNESVEYVRQAERDGRAFVIRPDEKLPIGHIEHNGDNLRNVYEIGRSIAEKRLSEMKEFLR